MGHHCLHKQNDNDSWQQPNRTDNDIARQRHVNRADSKNRGYRLPTRFWLVNVSRHLRFSA
jgi:hypothetical protein